MCAGTEEEWCKKWRCHKHPEKAITDAVTDGFAFYSPLSNSFSCQEGSRFNNQTPSCSEETALLYNRLRLSWAARQIPCERSVSLRASASSWLCVLVLVGSRCAPLLQPLPLPGGSFTGWACAQSKYKFVARGGSVALDLYHLCWCIWP